MSELLKQHILKNGLNLGAILVFITISTYLGGPELVTNYTVSFGTLLVMLVFPIYHTRKFRIQSNGFISFKQAFTSCTVILIAAGFINVAASILLYNVIDPAFAIEMLDVVINKMVSQLESLGMNESQIEESIKALEESSSFDPISLFKGYLFSIIFYTLFGLLVAAFTKNENPEFSE